MLATIIKRNICLTIQSNNDICFPCPMPTTSPFCLSHLPTAGPSNQNHLPIPYLLIWEDKPSPLLGYLLFFNVMFFFTFEAVFYAFGRKSRRVHSRSPSCQAIQSPPRDSIVNGLSRFFPETRGANTSMCMYAFFSFFQTGAQYTYSSMIVS